VKLNTKLLVTHAIVGACLLLVSGYLVDAWLTREAFDSIYARFLGQLYHVDFALTNFLTEVEYDVLDLVDNDLVRTRDDAGFTSFLEADEDTFEYNIGDTEQAIIDLFNTYRTNHAYANSVYMGRENGSFVRSHKRARPTQYDPRLRPWYQLALTDPGKVHRTEPYRSVTTPDVNIGTVKALVDSERQVYGVVGIDITLRTLTEYITNIPLGQEGYIVLLDDKGIILTGQDQQKRFKTYDEAGLGYFREAMVSDHGYTTFADASGEYYLFYYTSPELKWKICAVVPHQQIDREVHQMVNWVLLLLALALLLLSVLTVLGVRRFILQPIKKLERSTETIIHTGDLEHQIEVESQDEIGQLATSFNEMVASIERAEEELRESEEKYRTLVENLNIGIFRSTPGGRLLHANSAAIQMLGYDSLQEALTIQLADLYEDSGERERMIRRLEAGKGIKNLELRLVKKNGTPIWVSLSVAGQYDQDGTLKWLEGVLEDTTARKEAEDALRRAHEELELRVAERTTALTASNTLLRREIGERRQAERAVREREQFLALLNDITRATLETPDLPSMAQTLADRLGEMFGADSCYIALWDRETQAPIPAAAYGQWREVYRSVSVDPDEATISASVLETGLPVVVEDVHDSPYLSPRLADLFPDRSLLGLPLIAAEQKLGVAIVAFDQPHTFTPEEVTRGEQAAAQVALGLAKAPLVEELQQSVAELQARHEELDAFAHTVAHDLKNPISTLVGYAEVVEQESANMSDEMKYRFLQTIARKGRKVNTIVDELLLLASVREAEALEMQPLDMKRIVAEARGRLLHLIEELEAEIVLPTHWPLALGHAPWVEEVWINYISNALKYGGRPPRVELGATLLADRGTRRPMIRFWIRDNGPGLTAEEQANLFTPFERLHQVRAQGHGLGLSIVRRIVHRLGGEVGVESDGRPGQGCTFSFTLPALPLD